MKAIVFEQSRALLLIMIMSMILISTAASISNETISSDEVTPKNEDQEEKSDDFLELSLTEDTDSNEEAIATEMFVDPPGVMQQSKNLKGLQISDNRTSNLSLAIDKTNQTIEGRTSEDAVPNILSDLEANTCNKSELDPCQKQLISDYLTSLLEAREKSGQANTVTPSNPSTPSEGQDDCVFDLSFSDSYMTLLLMSVSSMFNSLEYVNGSLVKSPNILLETNFTFYFESFTERNVTSNTSIRFSDDDPCSYNRPLSPLDLNTSDPDEYQRLIAQNVLQTLAEQNCSIALKLLSSQLALKACQESTLQPTPPPLPEYPKELDRPESVEALSLPDSHLLNLSPLEDHLSEIVQNLVDRLARIELYLAEADSRLKALASKDTTNLNLPPGQTTRQPLSRPII